MRLAHNIVWNAAGIVLPLVVGVAVVPAIVHGLGTVRFGFLSIVWMLIGYFGIFDFGLGRTLTKLVADRLGSGQENEVPSLTGTAVMIVGASGILAGLGVALLAGWIARLTLAGSPALIPEATNAIVWLAVSLPFVLVATVLTGLFEAYQRFALISAVRLPLGILILVAPLAVLPLSRDLGVITAVLATLRFLNAVTLGCIALRIIPALRREALRFRRELIAPLLTYGGWLTVSNVVGPVMIYFDRFVIAAMLGSAAIAYYTVPYDVLNRLLLLPQAIQGVLFPNFALLRAQNSPRVLFLFTRSSTTNMLLMLPPLLATLWLAREGLGWWVGDAFAQNSTQVAKILVVGVLVNAMARTPFVFVQGVGRAKWTAILHMSELPFYAVVLWLLLRGGIGIEGAAYAWSGRIAVDTIALYVMTARLEPRLSRTVWRDLAWIVSACVGALCVAVLLQNPFARLAVLLLVSVICAAILLTYFYGGRPILAKGRS
jgi:O-antigen/teichoic acid export membrane protein